MAEKKNELDFEAIAKALGAVRRGKVPARSGFIGAMETGAAVQALQAESRTGR